MDNVINIRVGRHRQPIQGEHYNKLMAVSQKMDRDPSEAIIKLIETNYAKHFAMAELFAKKSDSAYNMLLKLGEYFKQRIPDVVRKLIAEAPLE